MFGVGRLMNEVVLWSVLIQSVGDVCHQCGVLSILSLYFILLKY